MLEFSVSNQTLTRLDETAVVADSVNYLDCRFTFSPDWEGVTPVATFGHSEVAEPITVMIVDGVCRVPWEVIRPYGFYMAVYGSGKSGEGIFTHIPTDTVTVEVAKSGVEERLAPASPTPDMYDTLMAEIQAGVAAATEAKESAQRASDHATSQAMSAGEARSVVQAAQQNCVTYMARAQAAADKAERAAEGVSAETALAVSARQELDDTLVLCKSYAVGTEEYGLKGGTSNGLWDASGTYTIGSIGMAANRRYLVKIDGVWYEGISHMVIKTTPGTGEPPVDLFSVSDDEELTPEIPGGDDTDPPITPDDPAERYEEGVELKAGPVTIMQWNTNTPKTEITTTDRSVNAVWVYTDGHDNAKYYMEQAQAAMARCESILKEIKALQGG